MKIILFIGSLQSGGAERQISLLATKLAQKSNSVLLTTLYPGGTNWDSITGAKNVELISLNKKKSIFPFSLLQLCTSTLKLRKIIKKNQPEIIYSMLEITNFIAWLASRGKFAERLIWGIRTASVNYSKFLYVFVRLGAAVSPTVKNIIANSEAGRVIYKSQGYHPQNFRVIHNSLDTNLFKPDDKIRKKIRRSYGIKNEITIGNVARLNPYKDHPVLFRAFAKFNEAYQDSKLLLVGDGPAEYKHELYDLARNLGIQNKLIWLDSHNNISKVYNAMDMYVQSSNLEGTPNVVMEAMACGIPVVATNVGDTSAILNGFGEVVQPRSAEDLCAAMINLAKKKKSGLAKLTHLGREHILKNFSLDSWLNQHELVFHEIVK